MVKSSLPPHATSQDLAHLHSEHSGSALSPSFFTPSLLLSAEGHHSLVHIHALWLLLESTGPSEECNAASSVSSCFLPHASQQIEVRKPRMCVYGGTYVTTLLPIVLPGQLGQKSAAGVPAGFEWGTAGSRAWGQGICKRQHFLAPTGLPRDKA